MLAYGQTPSVMISTFPKENIFSPMLVFLHATNSYCHIEVYGITLQNGVVQLYGRLMLLILDTDLLIIYLALEIKKNFSIFGTPLLVTSSSGSLVS